VGNLYLLWHGTGTTLDAVQAFFFVGVAVAYTAISIRSNELTRFADFCLRRDLERANADLRELDRLKTRFFANVSHELRTPLTLILSPLETLLEKDGPPARRALETIHANAVRLLKQINALLDFARLDEGRVKLNVDHHELGEVVRRICESAQAFAERRGIRLASDIPVGLPKVWSDLDMIEKVVYNLLSNALKFTPEGGAVTLRVWADAERFWISCRDTGPGISEEARAHIFERFQQTSSSSRASGSGIGLSLARELARLHKGDIEVASRPGEGADFRVWLPLKSPLEGQAIDRRKGVDRREGERRATPDPEAERRDSPQPAGEEGAAAEERRAGERRSREDRRDSSRYQVPRLLFEANEYGPSAAGPAVKPEEREGTVLVADDHREMREYVRMLVDDRYTVVEAADGREALERAREARPDVIIADLMMPEMDGNELTRLIREDAALAMTPVIIVTARAELASRLGGLKGGANDYLVKPFHPHELRAKIDAFMRLRRFEREIAEKSDSLARSLRELGERESRLAAIGRMASTIVHDLRNPLTTVVGFSQLALQAAEEKNLEEIAEDLRPVVAESARLRQMVEEILAFARGAAAKIEPARARVKEMLALATAFARETCARADIAVEVDAGRAGDAPVLVDREAMQRVFENLIGNARDAIHARPAPPAGPRGRIRLSAALENEGVAIRVVDDGCGIPAGLRGRLFEPFATAGKAHGTGLGLATVKNLVRAHGGEITLEPDPPGGGAAFRIFLPLAPEKVAAEAAAGTARG
jgi:signal transduction histidine kinase